MCIDRLLCNHAGSPRFPRVGAECGVGLRYDRRDEEEKCVFLAPKGTQ